MQTSIFTKSRVATALSLALATSLPLPLLAQQTAAPAAANKAEEKVEVIEILQEDDLPHYFQKKSPLPQSQPTK